VSKRQAWGFFVLLGVIWGSSFLLMRIAVEEMPPAQVTFTRVGIAAICLNLLFLLRGRRWPTKPGLIVALVVIGLGNTAVPFTLLAWGEQTVESGMTSIIQAITPIFALVIAHFAFADEKITPVKTAGIVLSFSGIVVLASRDLANGDLLGADLSGELAVLGASLCYAIFTTYSRRVLSHHQVEPLLVSTVTMTAAAVGALVAMYTLPLVGERQPVAYPGLSGGVLLSGLALGFFNTFLAYLLFYQILPVLGAARSTMVTYVVPVVAVTLGAVFLNEVIDARILLGAALILGGIAVANIRLSGRAKPAAAPPIGLTPRAKDALQ
jgi:drug/metabolite transporter (DMT)-like permease